MSSTAAPPPPKLATAMSWSAVAKAAGKPSTTPTPSASPTTSTTTLSTTTSSSSSAPPSSSPSSSPSMSPQPSGSPHPPGHFAGVPTVPASSLGPSAHSTVSAGHSAGAAFLSPNAPLPSASLTGRAAPSKPSTLQPSALSIKSPAGRVSTSAGTSPQVASPNSSPASASSSSHSSFSSTAPLQFAAAVSSASTGGATPQPPPTSVTPAPFSPPVNSASSPPSSNGEVATSPMSTSTSAPPAAVPAAKPFSAWAKPLVVASTKQSGLPPSAAAAPPTSSAFSSANPSTLSTALANGAVKRPSLANPTRASGGTGAASATAPAGRFPLASSSSSPSSHPTGHSPSHPPSVSPSSTSMPSPSNPPLSSLLSAAPLNANGSSPTASNASHPSVSVPLASTFPAPLSASSALPSAGAAGGGGGAIHPSPSSPAAPPALSPAGPSRGSALSYSTIVAKTQPSTTASPSPAASPSLPPLTGGPSATHKSPVPSHPFSNGPHSLVPPSTPSPAPLLSVPSTPPPSSASSASPALSPTSASDLSSSPTSAASPSASSAPLNPPGPASAGKKKSKKKNKKKGPLAEGAEAKDQPLDEGGGAGDSAAVTPLSHSPSNTVTPSPFGAIPSDDSHDMPPPYPVSRMPPGADHAQKMQEHFPMRQTPQGGFVILPPDQSQPPQSQTQPQSQGQVGVQGAAQQSADLSPVTHQSSPRRVFTGGKTRGGSGPGGPSHPSHSSPNLSYRNTPPRRGLPFPPQSPQRHSPSYRGRNLNQQPRHPQGYGYYPQAPYSSYASIDSQHGGMEGGEEEGAVSPLQVGMGGMAYPHMQMQMGMMSYPQNMMGMMPGLLSQQVVGSSTASPALTPMQLLQQQQQAGQQVGPVQAAQLLAIQSRRDDIRKQIEYYFSEDNLARDVYLRTLMNDRGYVSLLKLLSFNKLRLMSAEVEELVQCALLSPHLKVKSQAVRLRHGWAKWIPPPPEGEERHEDSSEDDTHSTSDASYDPLNPSADDVNGGLSDEQKAGNHVDSPLNSQGPLSGMMGGQPGGGGYYHPMPPHQMYYQFPPYGYPAAAYYPSPYYTTAQLSPALMQQHNSQQHFAAQHQQQQQHAQAQAQAQQQQAMMEYQQQQHQRGGGGQGMVGMDGQGRRGPQLRQQQSYHHRGRGGRGGHPLQQSQPLQSAQQQGAPPKRGGMQGSGQFSGAPSPQSARADGAGGGLGGPITPPHDS